MSNTNSKQFTVKTSTRRTKYSGYGFLNRKNCYQYLNSTSLTFLTAQFYAMLHDEVVYEGIRHIDLGVPNIFTEAYNGFAIDVVSFVHNASGDYITVEVEAINSANSLAIYNHSRAIVKVSYKYNRKYDWKATKDKGTIHNVTFEGHYYYIDYEGIIVDIKEVIPCEVID